MILESANKWLNKMDASRTSQLNEDKSNPLDLGDGVKILYHKNNNGKEVPFTYYDGRVFLTLSIDGKPVRVYQSFAGTGGKQQGSWFPCGPVIDDPKANFSWIVKGSVKTDPGMGRPALTAAMNKINNILPHSDEDTIAFLRTLAPVNGWDDVDTPEYETKQYTLEELSPSYDFYTKLKNGHIVKDNTGEPNSLYQIMYEYWTKNFLNKNWGSRGQEPPTSTTPSNDNDKQNENTAGTEFNDIVNMIELFKKTITPNMSEKYKEATLNVIDSLIKLKKFL